MYSFLRKAINHQKFKIVVLYKYRKEFLLLHSLEKLFFQLSQGESNTFGWYDNDDFSKVLIISVAKNIHRARSISILCKKGLAKDVIPLMRIIFEELLDLKYMQSDKDLLRDYVDYDVFNRLKLARMIDKDLSGNERMKDGIKSLEKEWDLHKERFTYTDGQGKKKIHNRWTKMNVADLSNRVGLNEDYKYMFGYLSHYIHSTTISAEDYILGQEGKDVVLEVGDSDRFIVQVLLNASAFFIFILKMIGEEYKIESLNKKLETMEVLLQQCKDKNHRSSLI